MEQNSLAFFYFIADDVGDHAISEHSVFYSPDELCWTQVILPVLPRCTQTIHRPTPVYSSFPSHPFYIR